MIPIKLLAASAAVALALPAAAQNAAGAEKRTGAQASTQSAENTAKERRKAAKPCSARSGKSGSAK